MDEETAADLDLEEGDAIEVLLEREFKLNYSFCCLLAQSSLGVSWANRLAEVGGC
jgi:hypothetical protein